MSFISFSPNTKIKSADINSNFAAIASGAEVANAASGAWTAVLTGFSGTPTQANSYITLGKYIILFLNISGTSNQTYFTFTGPVAAKVAQAWMTCRVMDSNAWKTTAALITSSAGSATFNVFVNGDGGTTLFTAANSKAILGMIIYEI